MIKKVWKSAIAMILVAMMFATHSIASSGPPNSGEQRDSTYVRELGYKADVEFRGPRRGPGGPMAQESNELPDVRQVRRQRRDAEGGERGIQPGRRGPRPDRDGFDRWLNDLTKAYEQKDMKKIGQLIEDMKQRRQRLQSNMGRPSRGMTPEGLRGPGRGMRPGQGRPGPGGPGFVEQRDPAYDRELGDRTNVEFQGPHSGGQPPREKHQQGEKGREDSQPLTAEQKAEVKSILLKYDESSLTADDARAINEAFRIIGLRNGPGLQEAIREAGFVPEKIGALAPPPDRPGERGRQPSDRQGPNRPNAGRQPSDRPRPDQGNRYSIEQAISDRAQLHTIAFDALAFLTGDLGSCTFLPPGKVADFCGFQYMRDVDTHELGHNTSFVPRAANNVLYILTEDQKAQLVALAKEQEKLLADFAYKRFPLIKGFCRQLEGEIPAGSTGLNREAVMKYAAEFFEIDGLLSYERAKVLGGIIRSLTAKQKEYLGRMVFNNSATWPEMKDQLDKKRFSRTVHVAVMTYASEMFSWYAGSVETDVYFCPERHATYFGSFYMKDIPAMGNPNYSISTALTGDSGESFLAALTEPQRKLITDLVDIQRKDLNEIIQVRRAIATQLRRFMKEESVDKNAVLSLARRYGELDGEISYHYAMHFAQVGKTFSDDQQKILLELRNLDSKYACKGAYLYSEPIDMPEIENTDFLFGVSHN